MLSFNPLHKELTVVNTLSKVANFWHIQCTKVAFLIEILKAISGPNDSIAFQNSICPLSCFLQSYWITTFKKYIETIVSEEFSKVFLGFLFCYNTLLIIIGALQLVTAVPIIFVA